MKDRTAILVAVVFIALAVWLGTYYSFNGEGIARREVPRCPEDSVLVGAGQFEDHTWTRYRCGPSIDDYRREVGRV